MKNLITLTIVLIAVIFIFRKKVIQKLAILASMLNQNVGTQYDIAKPKSNPQKCAPGFVWNRYTGCTDENELQPLC